MKTKQNRNPRTGPCSNKLEQVAYADEGSYQFLHSTSGARFQNNQMEMEAMHEKQPLLVYSN